MDRIKEIATRGKRERDLKEQQQRDLEVQRRLAEQRADAEARHAREARERAEDERQHRRAIEIENQRLRQEENQRRAEMEIENHRRRQEEIRRQAEMEDQLRRRFEAEQQAKAAQEEERLRRKEVEKQKLHRRNVELQMQAMQEAEAQRQHAEAVRAAQQQQAQEERARRDRIIAQQQQEEENRRQERLRNTSPESLYRLRDLIRQRYQLDIKIWGMRGVMRGDQKIAIAHGREADAILQQIYDVIKLWEEAAFRENPREWQLACQIRDSIQQSNPRIWEGNPPWNDEPEKDEDDFIFF